MRSISAEDVPQGVGHQRGDHDGAERRDDGSGQPADEPHQDGGAHEGDAEAERSRHQRDADGAHEVLEAALGHEHGPERGDRDVEDLVEVETVGLCVHVRIPFGPGVP